MPPQCPAEVGYVAYVANDSTDADLYPYPYHFKMQAYGHLIKLKLMLSLPSRIVAGQTRIKCEIPCHVTLLELPPSHL